MHLLAEGIEGETETLGDILLTVPIDENGAKSFVEALRIAYRLAEEALATCVVHNGIPWCESLGCSIGSARIPEQRK
jgi:hypothetical protein